MKRNETYNTKQKDLILRIIKKQNHEFTVKDIYEKVKDNTGLTTVYRLVDKLVSEGYLNKHISKDNVTYYEYLEECHHDDHFFLKCEKCGTLIHVDCECINDLSDHLLNNHNFSINKKNIILNGLCESCKKGI